MQVSSFGEKLQILRRQKGFTQKEFAEYLGIPQPSVSAYEKEKNSPTMEVLVSIAEKCNVSLDWLCSLSSTPQKLSVLGDINNFFFQLMELNEVRGEIEINDCFPGDIETETNKYYARITFYGNDHRYPYNLDVCNMLNKVKELTMDLETFALSQEMYSMAKEKRIEYYDLPLTQKVFPEYSREELMKKRIEYLKSLDS